MNADRLLALYEKVSEAPDAIDRLRRFVLDLAVRGKLVAQDPSDEPASDLLKRIAVAREEAPKTGRNGARKLADRSLTDLPFVLPNGWSKTNLSNLVRVVNGRAYKKSELLEEGIPVLRVGNLFTSDRWYFSNLELEYDKYCDKGDLIYAWSASFGPFIWDGPRVIYHYHIWKLPLFSEADLDRQFLYLFLLQKTRAIKEAGHGISMVHMTKEGMEQLAVPLPPLAEQRRIVGKVEELMALLDRLEAARTARETTRDRLTTAGLARLTAPATDLADFPTYARFALNALPAITARPDQVKALRQTILNLAVRGKLVEQDPTDEPAADLLKQIDSERTRLAKAGAIRSKKRPVPLGDIELPFVVPSGWRWTSLAQAFVVTGGIQKTPARAPKTNAFPYLGVGNVYRNRIDLTNLKEFELRDGEIGKFKLQKFDIMVVEGNGSAAEIGRCAMWEGQINECVHQNHLIRCRPINPDISRFAMIYLNSPLGTDKMRELSITSAGLYNLSVGKISSIPVPLPPVAEQHRIVAKVDALMGLCDRLEAALTTADTIRARLLEALLAEALAEPELREMRAAE